MQDLMQFIINHWVLSACFLVLLVLLFIEEARSKGIMSQITPSQATQMLNHEQAIILDIRAKDAVKQGAIIHSMNIPRADIERNLNRLTQYKTKPIILVCENSRFSSSVATLLRKQGFERVYVLAGGINGWKNAQMPLVSKK